MANTEHPPLLRFSRTAAIPCERPKAPLFISLALPMAAVSADVRILICHTVVPRPSSRNIETLFTESPYGV
jgi:hypothetical protein